MSSHSEATAGVEGIQSKLLEGIKENAGWAIAIGVISMVLGFLALWAPLIAGLSVTVVVGSLMSLSGVAHLIFVFKAGSFGKGALTFVSGALSLFVGLSLIFEPFTGLLSLTLLLAFYFFISGISEIFGAFKLRGAKGWVWALISGAMSLLLGIMIWSQFPVSGEWAVGLLTGFKMIFGGSSLIAIGSGVRGVAAAQQAAA